MCARGAKNNFVSAKLVFLTKIFCQTTGFLAFFQHYIIEKMEYIWSNSASKLELLRVLINIFVLERSFNQFQYLLIS